jgi:PAS domain S-box-containing protein
VLLDNAPIALAVVGSDGVIEYANPSAAALTGADDPSELIGSPVYAFVVPAQRRALNELLRHITAGLPAPEVVPIRGEGVSLRGQPFHVEVSAGLVEFAGSRALLVQAKDITKQTEAEADLQRHEERLRALKADLVSKEERARMDLSRAFHDNIGQPLAMARLALQGWAAESEVPHEDLERALRLLDSAIGETRQLTMELVPRALHDFGTATAVFRLAEDLEPSYGLHVHVEGGLDDVGVSEEARAVLVRSVREILINVAKHAGVNEARVTLSHSLDEIRVEVEDDGVGFDPGSQTLGETFGLFSIYERLPLLGGSMTIHSAPGKGTRVTLKVARRAGE